MKFDVLGENGEVFTSLASGVGGINVNINERDCFVDGYGESLFKIFVTGSCAAESRIFTFKLNKYGPDNVTDIEFTELPEGFTLVEDNANHMKYSGMMSPGMNETMEKEFKYKVHRMSGIMLGSNILYPRTSIQTTVTNQFGGSEGQFDIRVNASFWYANIKTTNFDFNFMENLAQELGTTVELLRSASCGTENFSSPLRFIVDADGQFNT
ncbi:MAG: hypothetical protein ACI86M_000863 [Saprospiraceae bacterium]